MAGKTNKQPTKDTSVSVKQAVAKAFSAAKELYANEPLTDLALEEVEKSEDGRFWLITLGFSVPIKVPRKLPIEEFVDAFSGKKAATRYERKYKVFHVEVRSGRVDSMKIRSL